MALPELNGKEGAELWADLANIMSGGSREVVGVVDFLGASPTFQLRRIEPFDLDLETVDRAAKRLQGVSGSCPEIAEMSNLMDARLGVMRGRTGRSREAVTEGLVRAAIVPMESVVLGAEILRHVADGLAQGSLVGFSKRILRAVSSDEASGRAVWVGPHRRENQALGELCLGHREDERNRIAVKRYLGPYIYALEWLDISNEMFRASQKYRDLSAQALHRSQRVAGKIRPAEAARAQGKLNSLMGQISQAQWEAGQILGKSTDGLAGVGVVAGSPEQLAMQLTEQQKVGRRAELMERWLKERDSCAGFIRHQVGFGTQTVAEFVEAVTLDTTGVFTANLAAVTQVVGVVGIVNVALRQTAAAAGAIDVATHYLLRGDFRQTDELEARLESRFRAADQVFADLLAAQIPEARGLDLTR